MFYFLFLNRSAELAVLTNDTIFSFSYVDKLTEFLRSFVGCHLRRFEGHAHFPILQFMALLFKYTFLQTNVESFYSCLEAWNTCMDYISTALGNRRTEGLRILERYTIKR